jgi:hypothetical protein
MSKSQSGNEQHLSSVPMLDMKKSSFSQWQIKLYEWAVQKYGGEVVAFLDPRGNGQHFVQPIPKFSVIIQERRAQLLDLNMTQPIDAYPAEMFNEIESLTTVSIAEFKLHEKLLEKAMERSQRRDEENRKEFPAIFVDLWLTQPLDIQNKIEAITDFKQKQKTSDIIWLYKTIKQTCVTAIEGVCEIDFIHIVKNIISCHQGSNESNAQFFKRFNHQLDNYVATSEFNTLVPLSDEYITALFIDNLNASNTNFSRQLQKSNLFRKLW